MTDIVVLALVIAALTRLGLWLDAAWQREQTTDPREAVDRAHRWDGGE